MWALSKGVMICLGVMNTHPDRATMEDVCQAFADTRGPYKTEEICEARIEEMRDTLVDIFQLTNPMPVTSFGYGCKQLGESA